MGGRPKQTLFFQRRHIDGQQTHEKMLNIAYYQRNANRNYNEIIPHTIRMDTIERKEERKKKGGEKEKENSKSW